MSNIEDCIPQETIKRSELDLMQAHMEEMRLKLLEQEETIHRNQVTIQRVTHERNEREEEIDALERKLEISEDQFKDAITKSNHLEEQLRIAHRELSLHRELRGMHHDLDMSRSSNSNLKKQKQKLEEELRNMADGYDA